MCYSCGMMTIAEVISYLQTVDNTWFSQAYRIPLRTLVRVKSGKAEPRKATMEALSKAIAHAQKQVPKCDV